MKNWSCMLYCNILNYLIESYCESYPCSTFNCSVAAAIGGGQVSYKNTILASFHEMSAFQFNKNTYNIYYILWNIKTTVTTTTKRKIK